jgi:hypothetical protein
VSTIDDLAARQSGSPDPVSAAEELAAILDLGSVGLSIRGGRIVGRGSSATADIYLSDGDVIEFESLRQVANQKALTVEVCAWTGATPTIKAPQAVRAVALLRALSDQQRTSGEDDLAREWGSEFLQAADVIDLDMTDRVQRWDAFSRLGQIDPGARYRGEGLAIAKTSLVLRHHDGVRLVRTGWFRAHVHTEDHGISPQQIRTRMQRVGWELPGHHGNVKAARPAFKDQLVWQFYRVPAEWGAEE